MSSRLVTLALAGVLFTSSHLSAQTLMYTRPLVPDTRDLDRLNLNLQWHSYLPVDNIGDGVGTLQVMGDQVFAMLRNGRLAVMNATNGRLEWQVTLPKRYNPIMPVAANESIVFAVNGPMLFIMDRKTGKRLYTTEMPSMAAAPPVADNVAVYVVLNNNTIVSFSFQPEDIRKGLQPKPKFEMPEPVSGISVAPERLDQLSTTTNPTPSLTALPTLKPPFQINRRDVSPSIGLVESLRPPYKLETGNRTPSVAMDIPTVARLEELAATVYPDRPKQFWTLQANRRMHFPPILFNDIMTVPGDDGSVFSARKYAKDANPVIHEFLSESLVSAPLNSYAHELYVPQTDTRLYALTIENFKNNDLPIKPLRTFTAGGGIDRKPLVTDDSIYVATSTAGGYRINRKTFELLWSNPEIDRFLTASARFAYAMDRRGNLMILDKTRGIKLSTYNVRDYGYPIMNEQDDRIYLAAHNGLLLCLHDRYHLRPEKLRKNEFPAPAKDGEPKKEPEPQNPANPKKDDMKN